jgi:hypothetical protein
MRAPLAILAAALGVPLLAAATAPGHPRPTHAPAAAEPPKPLGTFDNWVAATHRENGQTICYAFTRAQASAPRLRGRGPVLLTVTERPSGRDEVAISAGYRYPANADVKLKADQVEFDFTPSESSAFARDGHAAVAAFLKAKGREAVARGAGPRNVPVTDSFSLRGFDAAYAVVNKACPPR